MWLIAAHVPHTLDRVVQLAMGNVLEMPASSGQGRGLPGRCRRLAFCLLSVPVPKRPRVSPRTTVGFVGFCSLSGSTVLLPSGPVYPYVTPPFVSGGVLGFEVYLF